MAMSKRRSKIARKHLPSCIADCVGGDVVRLPSGEVVRVLFKHWDSSGHVRAYDLDKRLPFGPEYELAALTAVVVVDL